MEKGMKIGVVGCGDFLRWQSDDLKRSRLARVKSFYDPDQARAKKHADALGGKVVATEDEIFNDPEISMVALFVPPQFRLALMRKAAAAGKHVISTKPLAPTSAQCDEMLTAVKGRIKAGVIYNRSGNAHVETMKDILASGEIGKLALFKQDWIHHYPAWNTWALDPKNNGGPFMDAMIHNLNIARYLMGRPASAMYFSSDNFAHPGLTCADTDFMKLDFAGASAHLFITWAADLAVHSLQGNDREHIDIFYMVTDQGWRVTFAWGEGGAKVVASKDGKNREWACVGEQPTVYDEMAASVLNGAPWPRRLPTLEEAADDIRLIEKAYRHVGERIALDMK